MRYVCGLAFVLLAPWLALGPASAQSALVTAGYPPPPLIAEEVPPQTLGLTWESGHWVWNDIGYVWRPGHSIEANSGFQRSQAQWQYEDGAWIFIAPEWVLAREDLPSAPWLDGLAAPPL